MKIFSANWFVIFKKFLIRNFSWFCSSLLFVITYLLLGYPYQSWGFYGDDFGNILNSQIHGFGDLIHYFKFGNVAHLFFPSNFVKGQVHFFNVLYRPVILIIFGFLSMLFGTNARAYFLVTIFIHALNAVLLFNIFVYFVEYFWAFLGALLFIFHPTLFGWFGWPAALSYQLALLVMTVLFFLLKKFIETSSNFYLIISVVIYFMALFVHEVLIVLPYIITVAILITECPQRKLQKAAYAFILFVFSSVTYLLIRLYFFPFQKNLFCNEFLPRIGHSILMKILYYIYAIPGLYVFFPNNFALRCTLTVVFLATLLVLFVFNTKKKLLVFLLFCIVTMSWCQAYNYSNRYFYVVIPFFILFLLIEINYFKIDVPYVNFYLPRIFCVLLSLTAVKSIFFIKKDLSFRQERSAQINSAFDYLVKTPNINGRIIYFIDVPLKYFLSGIAQAVWLRGCNIEIPIYTYDLGLNQNLINKLKNSVDVIWLKNFFSQRLAPLEKLNNHVGRRNCWIFWDEQNFNFFKVDFHENNIH